MLPRMKLLTIFLLASTAAFAAACPSTVPCQQDGEQMENTHNCKPVGNQGATTCLFSHRHLDHSNNQITVHSMWVDCQ